VVLVVAMSRTDWLTFTVPLATACSPGDAAKITNAYEYMEDRLHDLYRDHPDVTALSIPLLGKHPGEYRNTIGKLLGYPYKRWEGMRNKAKYFRILAECVRRQLASQEERVAVSRACASYGYDYDSHCTDIMSNAQAHGYYPTRYAVRNACAAGVVQGYRNVETLVLDYSMGDKQIITQDGLSYEIQCLEDWAHVEVHRPAVLRGEPLRYSKPRIRRDWNTGNLVIDVSYEAAPAESPGWNVMGVDLGLVKIVTGAVLNVDGAWYSTELGESRELQRLNAKRKSLYEEIGLIRARLNRAEERLMRGRDPWLEQHAIDLTMDRARKRAKLTRLKEHAAWVAARDIVAHARRLRAGVVRMEDLRFAAEDSGQWDYSAVQSRVSEVASHYGIRVEVVSAAHTSHEDPFTGVRVDPDSKRVTATSRGPMDRDYAAALVIATRGSRSRRGKTPSKGKPTPRRVVTGRLKRTGRRPGLPTRSLLHKLVVKSIPPGASSDVASSGLAGVIASAKQHLTLESPGMGEAYHPVTRF
jgi:hypothetical protein